MSTLTPTSTTQAPVIKSSKPMSRHRVFTMEFEVIVTFVVSEHTLKAVANITDGNVCANGWQISFNYGISIRSTSTYDSLMRRLRKAVLDEVQAICGLGEDDVTMISTSADWKLWQQITGLDHHVEVANSRVTIGDKFYLPAFDRQNRECERSGKTLMDISSAILLKHSSNN